MRTHALLKLGWLTSLLLVLGAATALAEEAGDAEASEAAEEGDAGEEAGAEEDKAEGDAAETSDTGEGDEAEAPAEEAPAAEAPAEEASTEEASTEEATPAPEEAAAEEAAPAAEEEAPAPAAPPVLTFRLSAEDRVRFNFPSDHAYDGSLGVDWTISNRARVGLAADFGPVYGFVQIQDVRTWGSEGSTTADGSLSDYSADGLDVHQAYAGVALPIGLDIRLGRQEVQWLNGRLLGSNDWKDQARSLDAVRLAFTQANFQIEALYSKMTERPIDDTDLTDRAEDYHLIAAHGGPRMGETLAVDGVLLVDVDMSTDHTRATAGAYAKGSAGILHFEVEGYGQIGRQSEALDYRAWMVGARFRVAPENKLKFHIGGGVDVLSGDDDAIDGVDGNFTPLWGLRHALYGQMDRYKNFPGDTRGGGLLDAMVNLALNPYSIMSLALDVHIFASPSAAEGEEAFHGVELDLGTQWKPLKPLTIYAGMWAYIPGGWHGQDLQPEIGGAIQTAFAFK